MQVRLKQSYLNDTPLVPILSTPNATRTPPSLCNNGTYSKTDLVSDRAFFAEWRPTAGQRFNFHLQRQPLTRSDSGMLLGALRFGVDADGPLGKSLARGFMGVAALGRSERVAPASTAVRLRQRLEISPARASPCEHIYPRRCRRHCFLRQSRGSRGHRKTDRSNPGHCVCSWRSCLRARNLRRIRGLLSADLGTFQRANAAGAWKPRVQRLTGFRILSLLGKSGWCTRKGILQLRPRRLAHPRSKHELFRQSARRVRQGFARGNMAK